MATAADLLREARSHLGYHEGPRNHTRFGEWYAGRHDASSFAYAPWCDMFLSYCARQVGLLDVVGDFAYTPYHADWFRDQGEWNHRPERGAIVFYDWSGSRVISRIDHVGIVEHVRSDGRIVVIEGNTSNAVRRRVRSQANVAGYGHPAYGRDGPHAKPRPEHHAAPKHDDHDRDDDWQEVIMRRLPLVRRSDRGENVRTVQGLCRARHSYNSKIDGVFGPHTEQAVRREQRQHHIAVDGVVGPHTWAVLLTRRDL